MLNIHGIACKNIWEIWGLICIYTSTFSTLPSLDNLLSVLVSSNI